MSQKRQKRECAPTGALNEKKEVFPPGSRYKLKKFVKDYLRLNVPDVRVCGCHAVPMDYLWFAYSRDQVYRKARTQGHRNNNGIRLAADAELNRSLGFARDDRLLFTDDW